MRHIIYKNLIGYVSFTNDSLMYRRLFCLVLSVDKDEIAQVSLHKKGNNTLIKLIMQNESQLSVTIMNKKPSEVKRLIQQAWKPEYKPMRLYINI